MRVVPGRTTQEPCQAEALAAAAEAVPALPSATRAPPVATPSYVLGPQGKVPRRGASPPSGGGAHGGPVGTRR